MEQVKDLTKLTIADLWREVKDEEDWWGDLKEETLRVVKRLLEEAMEVEMVARLGGGRYRRTELRRGHRNGYRSRSLLTELGLVERLRVPRDREGAYQSAVVERYQRRERKVNQLVRDGFLAGMSTRRVGAVLAPVLGEAPSPQTVSRIVRSLDVEVRRFQRQRIEDHYCYLILDGITLKVKGATGAKKKIVLCAYGITPQGERRMLSFRQATSESEAQWEAFLQDLYRRGLEGKVLELVVRLGGWLPWPPSGPGYCLSLCTPTVLQLKDWVHKLRNVAARLPRKAQEACLAGAKRVYQAQNRREAIKCFGEWSQQWRTTQPKAVSCLEEDLEELLSFMECPKTHWRKIRTTNAIERAFREVRRRTRPMSCFQNPARLGGTGSSLELSVI